MDKDKYLANGEINAAGFDFSVECAVADVQLFGHLFTGEPPFFDFLEEGGNVDFDAWSPPTRACCRGHRHHKVAH